MLTILHASDLQAGRPYRPRAADALVGLAHEVSPDVVVVSGDLTQRAKAREFRTVRALLERLPPVPTIAVPGNHDVPLFRVWERAFAPYRKWRRFIARDLDSVTRLPGATFVALNSSAPRRAIVNGRVDAPQVAFARRTFAEAPAGDLRTLVVHHHMIPVEDHLGGRPLPGADALLAAFREMGVELVLGGHIHQTRIGPVGGASGEAGAGAPVVVSCGTTTSRRGRGPELGRNSLTVVRVVADRIEVTPHLLDDGAERFEAGEALAFPRRMLAAAAPGERRST